MKHWYFYHSQKTMGHSYASLCESAVFVSSEKSKLCLGDLIWVIEGDKDTPCNYQIADCFRYINTDYPPFTGVYSDFRRKLKGGSSLLPEPVPVTSRLLWFKELHGRFITKQRFCASLADEPTVVEGLLKSSGVGI